MAFADMIVKERERLNTLRAEALTRRKVIDDEIAGIDHELKAITAYENAKTPRTAATKANGTRTRDGSRRTAVLAAITEAGPDGITPLALIEALGAKGDKKAETAIRAMLFQMKKKKQLGSKDGIYTLP